MTNERQLIIAGDNNQAATIACLNGLHANQYISVRDPHQLMPERRREGRTVWLFGTYYKRPGWHELRATCDACGFDVVEVDGRVVNTLKLDCAAWPEPMYLSDGDFDPEEVKRLMEADDDIELTKRALLACGYRVHLKERNGTWWVTAVKGLEVQYKHWHPLTNINQAMQLLASTGGMISIAVGHDWVQYWTPSGTHDGVTLDAATPQDLINAQCRAIVTACASLKPVP